MQKDTSSAYDPETLCFINGFFDEHQDDALWRLANLAKGRFPDKSVDQMETWVLKQKRADNDLLRQFRRGCKRASQMTTEPTPPEKVWFGIYRGAVSYLAGETGAGKSSALYNIAVHAAQNKPLWGISFGLERPLKVLYIDPENAKLQSAWKIKNIGQGNPDNLVIHPGVGVDLSDSRWQSAFHQMILDDKYDLVILDPLINLFMTVNENDNPEGARQIKFLQGVAHETKAAILVVHHMGKNIENGTAGSSSYGRGASSRLASADVGLLWRSKSEGDERDDTYREEDQGVDRNDQCRLKITKNRLGRQASLFLRMAGGDRFELSSHEAWRGRAEQGEKKTQMQLATEFIKDIVMGNGWKPRLEILAALKQDGIGDTNIDRALRQMVTDGVLVKQDGCKNAVEYGWAEEVAQGQAT